MEPRDWLINFRKKKGMTQEEVAKKTQINRSFYTQIENGIRNPSVDTAKKIADTLSFEWTLFFEASSHEMKQFQQNYTKGEFHAQH